MISVELLSGMGEALKELRWHARMKQVEVCRITGMTAPQVSRYENGHEMPTVESLVRYLLAVGADLCDLQRVLMTGKASARGAEPPPGEPTISHLRSRDVARRETASRARAAAQASMVDEVFTEADRRMGGSSALQEIVSGLVKLNLEGMERMEDRMQGREESVGDLKQAGKGKKFASE